MTQSNLPTKQPDAAEEAYNIAELFARDPLKLTTADIDKVIHHMREKRKQFKLTGTTKKPATPKLTKAEAAVASLDIDIGEIKL